MARGPEYLTPAGREAARVLASELLTESVIRGDQDIATVDWAVSHLLRRSRDVPADGTAGTG